MHGVAETSCTFFFSIYGAFNHAKKISLCPLTVFMFPHFPIELTNQALTQQCLGSPSLLLHCFRSRRSATPSKSTLGQIS
jgi:hypothetical protein